MYTIPVLSVVLSGIITTVLSLKYLDSSSERQSNGFLFHMLYVSNASETFLIRKVGNPGFHLKIKRLPSS